MRRIFYILLVMTCLWMSCGDNTNADTLNLTTLPTTQYSGNYVGYILGNVNGGSQMGFVCNDYVTTTYVPSSFSVHVSTLADLSQTKFGRGNTAAALIKYEEAAWLLAQMSTNSSQVGQIQYAIWSLFSSSTPSKGQNDWLARAAAVDYSQWDFSSVRIYTATDTLNQELMTGAAVIKHQTTVPVPTSLLLLAPGVFGLVLRKCRKKVSA